MASQPSTVEFIVDQMTGAGTVSARKMFGEYAIYCDGKLVALVCDDQLFMKPTKSGRTFIGDVTEAPPYNGAKPYFLISGERWDNGDWLGTLARITAAELPLPLKKKRRKAGNQPARR